VLSNEAMGFAFRYPRGLMTPTEVFRSGFLFVQILMVIGPFRQSSKGATWLR